MTALQADQEFFDALVKADLRVLERLLADDFLIVDVMRGGEASKDMLLAVLGGMLRFLSIQPSEVRVREYGDAAVVNGRTQMKMTFGPDTIEVLSRYTHVYVRRAAEWLFVSAQGTRIVE